MGVLTLYDFVGANILPFFRVTGTFVSLIIIIIKKLMKDIAIVAVNVCKQFLQQNYYS